MISAGVLLSAFAAANPPKPQPTMMTLGFDMLTSILFLSANSVRTLDQDAPIHAAFVGCFVRVKFGARFSRNAANASLASAERSCAENTAFSDFAACCRCSRVDCLINLLQACSASADFSANFCAVAVAVEEFRVR